MRIPGPKWGAGRPPLETPKSSLARPFWPNSSPLARLELRCRWGKCERVRARHGRRTSTASGWGLAPPCPRVPQRGRLPIMRASAWDRVRFGFAGNAFANLRGSSCREAARSSVTPLARLWPQATLARPPAGGIPKGAQPSLASLCLLSAGQKVGARRGLSASKGKLKILRKRQEDKKESPERVEGKT